MRHVNANLLKVKLAISIISISSIHLLKTFIEVGSLGATAQAGEYTGETYTSTGVMWQVVIHGMFIMSALALALIEKMGRHPRDHKVPEKSRSVRSLEPTATTAQ